MQQLLFCTNAKQIHPAHCPKHHNSTQEVVRLLSTMRRFPMQWPWDFPSVRYVKQPHTCPEWPSEDIRVVPSQVAEGGGGLWWNRGCNLKEYSQGLAQEDIFSYSQQPSQRRSKQLICKLVRGAC